MGLFRALFRNGRLLGVVVALAIAFVIAVALMNLHTRRARVKALTTMESTCLTSQDNAKILVLMYVHSARCAAAARAVASYWSHAACPRRVTLAVYHVANHQTAAEFIAAVAAACRNGRYGFDFTPQHLRVTHVPENQDIGRLAAFGLLGKQYASEHTFFWAATDGAVANVKWDARFIDTWRALPDSDGDGNNQAPTLLVQNVHPDTQDIMYGTWDADKYGMPIVRMRALPRLHEDFVGTLEIMPAAAATTLGQAPSPKPRLFSGTRAVLTRTCPQTTALSLRRGMVAGPATLLTTTAAFGLHLLGGSPRYEATWLSAQLQQEGCRYFLCLEPLIITIPTTAPAKPNTATTRATAQPGLSRARRQGLHSALQRVTNLFTSGAPPIRTKLPDSAAAYAATLSRHQRQQRASQLTTAAITRALLLGLHRAGFTNLDADFARRHPLLSSPVAAHAAVQAWHQFAGLVVQRAARVEVGKPLATITVTGRGRMGLLPTANQRQHLQDVLSKFPNMQAYTQEKLTYNLAHVFS